jgi:hypothetical protein
MDSIQLDSIQLIYEKCEDLSKENIKLKQERDHLYSENAYLRIRIRRALISLNTVYHDNSKQFLKGFA